MRPISVRNDPGHGSARCGVPAMIASVAGWYGKGWAAVAATWSSTSVIREDDLQRALSCGMLEGVVRLHDVVEREAMGDQLPRR
jgi:hypothetical protein